MTNSPDKIEGNNHGQQSEHRDLYHYVYVFGATLGVGLIDFLFFWHDNHLIALLIGAAWLALISIFELRRYRKWQISVPIGWFATALIAYWIIGPNKIPEVEVSGLLQPGNHPTPVDPCLNPGENPGDNARVFLGTNALGIYPTGRSVIIQQRGRPILAANILPDGMSIDADILGEDGAVKARITANQFHVLTGESTIVQRRGDLSTLSIQASDGSELLFVRYLNPKAISVRGIFYGPGGRRTIITDDLIKAPGAGFSGSCLGHFAGVFNIN